LAGGLATPPLLWYSLGFRVVPVLFRGVDAPVLVCVIYSFLVFGLILIGFSLFCFIWFYFTLFCCILFYLVLFQLVFLVIVIIHLFSYSKCANKRFSVCWLVNVKAVVSLFKQQADYLAPSHSLRNSHPTGPARGIVASQGTFWVEALTGHNKLVAAGADI
jgi:hypothetical protein